jgi:S1-C subfamily serine protease
MKKLSIIFLFWFSVFTTVQFLPDPASYQSHRPISLAAELSPRTSERIVELSPFSIEQESNQALAESAASTAYAVVSVISINDNHTGVGSGFFITHDGYIVTNKHVVSDLTARYSVVLYDGTEQKASVVYRDPLYDIAIVKVEGTFPTVVSLGTSTNLVAGLEVASIGNVLGMYNNTISTGTVTGTNKTIEAEGGGIIERLTNLIQTSAFITPGFSGGPLINASGQVIGLNVAVDIGEAQSFAIPIDVVKSRVARYL